MKGMGQRSKRQYPLNQSPLYKLHNQRKLADLLRTDLRALRALASKQAENYRIFDDHAGAKVRTVEAPKTGIKRIHHRLFQLLSRIAMPSYLHSGVKGKSYISNARAHIGEGRALVKIDIAKFYPSTTRRHILSFFFQSMHCSRDVSKLLADLCTVNGHLPTGSCVSQLLAFFAHKSMFDSVHAGCESRDEVMTCYVDDIAVSGPHVSRRTAWEIRGQIARASLRIARRKERFYPANRPKLVTGVIIRDTELRLPNRRHQQFAVQLNDIHSQDDKAARLGSIGSALGRAMEAHQIESTFQSRIKYLQQLRRSVAKGA